MPTLDLPSADTRRGCWVLQWPVDEDWSAVGFYWLIDGALRLGEFRIVPRSAGDVDSPDYAKSTLAAWFASGSNPGARSVYPAAMRRAELQLRPMQKHMDDAAPFLAGWAKRRLKNDPERDSPLIRQAQELPADTLDVLTPAQVRYLQVAWYYVELSATHAHPNPKIAALLDIEVHQVRDRLRFARELRYLERGDVVRRAGGRLTPLGRALADKYATQIKRTTKGKTNG